MGYGEAHRALHKLGKCCITVASATYPALENRFEILSYLLRLLQFSKRLIDPTPGAKVGPSVKLE